MIRQPKNINIKQRSRKVDSEDKLVAYIKTQLGSPLITVDVTNEQILQSIDDAFAKWTDWAYDAQQHQVFVINVTSETQDYLLDDRVRTIYDCSIMDTTSSYGSGGGGSGINMGMMGGISMNSMMPPMYVPMITMQGETSSLANTGSMSETATGVAGGVAGPNSGGNSSGIDLNPLMAALSEMQTMQNLLGSSIAFDFNAQNHIFRLFAPYDGPVAIEAALEYAPNPDHDSAYGFWWIKAYSLNLTKKMWANNVGKYSQSLVGGAQINHDRLMSEAQEALDKLDEDLLEKLSEPMGIFSA